MVVGGMVRAQQGQLLVMLLVLGVTALPIKELGGVRIFRIHSTRNR